MKLIYTLLILIVFPVTAYSEFVPIYETVLKARECRSSKNELHCRYDIDNTFSMEILGVGKPDALIIFYKSDIKTGIYAKLSALHDCINVAQGLGNNAYISPKTGKVHKLWQECNSYK